MSLTLSWFSESTREQPEGGDSFDFNVEFLVLDILESESYQSTATITSHAVEEGIPTSDHIVLNADKCTFKAIVSNRQSNTDLVEDSTFGTTELEDGTEIAGVIVPEGTDRPGDIFDKLIELKNSGTKISITGLQKDIDEWLIESISYPRSVDTAGILVCDINISEIRTAVLEEVDAPSPRVERGRRSANSGNKKTKEAKTAEENQLASALSALGLGGGTVTR